MDTVTYALARNKAKAYTDGLVEPLDDRVTVLESLEKDRGFTFSQIHSIVSANLMSNYFNIGDQISVGWKDFATGTEYTIPFDVCHFFDGSDDDHPLVTMANGTTTKPGMAVMSHYALPFGTSISGREPFYIVPSGGLAAGTYNVTFGQSWGTNVVADKSYQFTVDIDLTEGQQLLGFDGAPDQAPSNWRVYVFDSASSTTPTKTYTVSEGTGGTNLGTFMNATRNGNLNALHCVAYGYNNSSKSALHQWLNSSEGVGEWWSSQHTWDHIPINATYSTAKAGFLTGFEAGFTDILGDVQIKTQGNNGIDGAAIDTYHGKFFPLSARQHYFANYLGETTAGYNASGVPWDYWKKLAVASGRTTPWAGWQTYEELITYDLAGTHTAPCSCWLRSPNCSSGSSEGCVRTSGGVSNYNACSGYRAVPAGVIV